jgi:hypothetical protein
MWLYMFIFTHVIEIEIEKFENFGWGPIFPSQRFFEKLQLLVWFWNTSIYQH